MAINDSDNVRILGCGSVYVAPLLTPLPALATDVFDAGFVDLGHVHEDGITEDPGAGAAITKFKDACGVVVRAVPGEKERDLKFGLLETKGTVSSVVYNDPAATDAKVEIRGGEGVRRSWILTSEDDVDANQMLTVFTVGVGQVTAVEAIEHKRTAIVAYKLTVTCYADANGILYTKHFATVAI